MLGAKTKKKGPHKNDKIRLEFNKIFDGIGGKEGYDKIKLYASYILLSVYQHNDTSIITDLMQDGIEKLATGKIELSEGQTYRQKLRRYIKKNMPKYIKARGVIPPKKERNQHSLGLEKGIFLEDMDIFSKPDETPFENIVLAEKIEAICKIRAKLFKQKSPLYVVLDYMLYRNNRTDEEIAKALGIKVNTVSKYKQRIKLMIK